MSMADAGKLFSHVTSEKTGVYRAILDCFAAAKRAFRLHLRPDDLLREARWTGPAPSAEELALSLDQLVAWGNLRSQADTARVSTLEDFYRRRLLYRLTAGGEADEFPSAGLVEIVATRRAVAPALWAYEVQNALHVLRRRKRLLGDDWLATSAAINALSIELEPPVRERIGSETSRLAQAHGLTIYGASYLELAQRRDLPLVTLDSELRRAAKQLKVGLA